MIKQTLSALVACALIGGAGYGIYQGLIKGAEEEVAPIAVKVVSTEDIEERIVCLGAVEPELFTDVKSEVSGRIAVVRVLSGEQVKRGDVLLELDRSELESEIKEAEFEIEASGLRVEKAQLDYDTKKGLAAKDFVSAREMKDADIDLRLAKNGLEIQRTKVATLQEKLAKTVIRAPHDGVVLANAALEGMVISGASSLSEGTLLMQVARLDRLLVQTSVNEIDVAKVIPEMKVKVLFDSLPGTEIEGTVVYISPSAEPESDRDEEGAKVFPVVVSFEADNARIRPGISANVEIVLDSVESVLAAALPTIFLEDGVQVVYVRTGTPSETDEVSFERRVVSTGISNTQVIEIQAGLKGGEELAITKPTISGGGAASAEG